MTYKNVCKLLSILIVNGIFRSNEVLSTMPFSCTVCSGCIKLTFYIVQYKPDTIKLDKSDAGVIFQLYDSLIFFGMVNY